MVLLCALPGLAADKLIFESAIGFGSRHMPYSSNWEGAVKSGALEYREFAVKSTCSFNDWLSAGLTTGWINDLLIPQNKYIVFYGDIYFANG